MSNGYDSLDQEIDRLRNRIAELEVDIEGRAIIERELKLRIAELEAELKR